MPPTVSIIVPTHNRAELLPTALASVADQTGVAWELIVVDDGSTDDTRAVVAALPPDPRRQYVYQANQGRAAARNTGAARATGQYLGFLDSDDAYLPEALAALLYQPTTQPDTALSLGGYTYVDASGQALGERRPWLESGLAVTDWLYNCLSMPGAALVRRDWFERLGGFDPACEIAEDWDFFLRLAYADGPMAWVRRSVCAYRLHPGNSTAGSARHRAGSVATLDKFFTQPNLPPELAAHAGPARAWLHVLFGQRACHNGEAALARAELEAARRADPSLATTRHAELLDLLLTRPADRLASSGANSVRACLPADWPVSAGELRAAEGRVAMAGFYAAWRRADWAEANRQLGRAVRRNPAWLFQRSVWVYSWQAMRGRHARR